MRPARWARRAAAGAYCPAAARGGGPPRRPRRGYAVSAGAEGTVLWSHCPPPGEGAAAAAARHDSLLESVQSLRRHTPIAFAGDAAYPMRGTDGGAAEGPERGGALRCVVACAGGSQQLPPAAAAELARLGVELRSTPTLREECEALAPGSGPFGSLFPALHRWLCIRHLGKRPRAAPVLSVDALARFQGDVRVLLRTPGPPSRVAACLAAPALPGLGALAPAVEAQPASLVDAGGDDSAVLFDRTWWNDSVVVPTKPVDGESPEPLSKQDTALRGLIIVAIALSLGCTQPESQVAQWGDPLLELLRGDGVARRSAAVLCGGFLACYPEDWTRRSSAAAALAIARTGPGRSLGAMPVAHAASEARAAGASPPPVVQVLSPQRAPRRLVLYSWNQSRRLSPLTGEPGLDCRHEQLLGSLCSLRQRAPDCEVRVTTYGDLPQKLKDRVAAMGVQLVPHWNGSYANCLDSVLPSSSPYLEFYPVLHKWFSVVSCSPEWDQVLYVDNDTLWADHPHKLFERYAERDFYAREGAQAKEAKRESGVPNEEADFRDLAGQLGIARPLELFNSGVMLFNRRCWRRIKDHVRAIAIMVLAFSLRVVQAIKIERWDDLQLAAVHRNQEAVRKLVGGSLPYPSINVWIREEIAATLALALAGLSQGTFAPGDAAQGLDERDDPSRRPVVSHYWSHFTEDFWSQVAPQRYWLPELQQHQEAVLTTLRANKKTTTV